MDVLMFNNAFWNWYDLCISFECVVGCIQQIENKEKQFKSFFFCVFFFNVLYTAWPIWHFTSDIRRHFFSCWNIHLDDIQYLKYNEKVRTLIHWHSPPPPPFFPACKKLCTVTSSSGVNSRSRQAVTYFLRCYVQISTR